MRPLAVLTLLLLIPSAHLRAQLTESKRMEQILSPRLDIGNPMQNKTYYSGGGGAGAGDSKASVKDFQYEQKFSPKAFNTNEFNTRSFWAGNFQFATKAADTKSDRDAGKTYATKAVEVKDARESGKDYATRGYATREAHPAGKSSQKKLDAEYLGKDLISMDQVRELLNKNK